MIDQSLEQLHEWGTVFSTLHTRGLRFRGEGICLESPREFLEVWDTNPHLTPKPGLPSLCPSPHHRPRLPERTTVCWLWNGHWHPGSLYPANLCPLPWNICFSLVAQLVHSFLKPTLHSALAETLERWRHWGKFKPDTQWVLASLGNTSAATS